MVLEISSDGHGILKDLKHEQWKLPTNDQENPMSNILKFYFFIGGIP
jgi:hypothetical protein